VIPVEFADIKHEESRDAINEMVFTRMNNYWHEVSYGQFNVIGDTVGWIDIGHDEAYYGRDTDPNDPGSDQRDPELIADACRLASGVDFSQYQSIMVVYAGRGQDLDRENTDLLWPSAYMSGLDVACGHKTFDSGGSTSEITRAGVLNFGTFTHEFGHTIGLPDLYNKRDKSQTDKYVGLWSLMASGGSGGPGNDRSYPTGLESWSRIKLGWLSSESISVTSDGSVRTLNRVGDLSGTRALKVALSGPTYYLLEVREKIGVDEYLPDSGLLITQIDGTKRSGEGIVKVMDCHPETESINDATCKVNEAWEDRSSGIYVKVIGKQGSNFVIAMASKPVSIVQFDPSVPNAKVRVDGILYSSDQIPVIFDWVVGSQHVLEVEPTVDGGSGIRYVFVGWDDGPTTTVRTITVSHALTYSPRFKTQYLLTVESPIGDARGSGWYDADSTATFSVSSPLPAEGILGLLGGKYVLDHWIGDSTATSPTSSLAMEGPKSVAAEWRADNTLPYAIFGAGAAIVLIAMLLSMRSRGASIAHSNTIDLRTQSAAAVSPESLEAQPGGDSCWCILCGKQILQDSVFCEYCGARQPLDKC